MTIYIGADHRGFSLKAKLLDWLAAQHLTVVDCGNSVLDPVDDYPDFAFAVAQKVAHDPTGLGVVLCGSGAGATVAANKVKGARCSLGLNPQQVMAGRHDDDVNMLTIATDFVSQTDAEAMIQAFIQTVFVSNERYQRRLDKIAQQEDLCN